MHSCDSADQLRRLQGLPGDVPRGGDSRGAEPSPLPVLPQEIPVLRSIRPNEGMFDQGRGGRGLADGLRAPRSPGTRADGRGPDEGQALRHRRQTSRDYGEVLQPRTQSSTRSILFRSHRF